MKKEMIAELNKTFEGSAYTQKGVEYWLARDVQKLLDYAPDFAIGTPEIIF
jgi:hypothetical protein